MAETPTAPGSDRRRDMEQTNAPSLIATTDRTTDAAPLALLSAVERDELARAEAVIERGLKTFMEVGQALTTIRDSRLYRESHGTFEDYCRDRWGFTDRRGRQLMEAAQIGTMVPVANERQARELAPLKDDPARMVEAWQRAVHDSGGRPNAALLRKAVTLTQRHLRERKYFCAGCAICARGTVTCHWLPTSSVMRRRTPRGHWSDTGISDPDGKLARFAYGDGHGVLYDWYDSVPDFEVARGEGWEIGDWQAWQLPSGEPVYEFRSPIEYCGASTCSICQRNGVGPGGG